MNAGFAGAKNIDERRRRRLAGFVEPTQIAPAVFASHYPIDDTPTSVTASASIPVHALIPTQRWKIGTVGVLGGLLIAGIAQLAGAVADPDFMWGAAGRQLLSADDGTLPRLLQALILFATAQLALIIRWVRQQSVRDFSGKYRCWTVVASVCWSICLLIGCNASLSLTHTAFSLGPWRFDFSSPWMWYSLLSGCWLTLVTLIWHELRRCRESMSLFICSTLLIVAHMALEHYQPLMSAESKSVIAIWIAGTALGAPWCLFLSLWLHARYVIYVSADPPEQKEKRMSTSRSPGIFSRLLGMLWPFGRSSTPTEQPLLDGESTVGREMVAPPSGKAVKVHTELKGSRFDDSHNEEDDRPTRSSRHRKKSRQQPEEAPIDKGMLKGLSKKERNRIRQQWRDELRTNSSHEPAA
ncbi:MAG: hypothetical protein ACKVT0_09790 [Planctomycetaceae bacterium]